jgi:hypothetical protein
MTARMDGRRPPRAANRSAGPAGAGKTIAPGVTVGGAIIAGVTVVEAVLHAPSQTCSQLIESGDRPCRQRRGIVIVPIGTPIVCGTLQASVELARLAVASARNNVVDIAPVGGNVAA